MDLIYLDHNSTTPLAPQAAAAMADAQSLANPASQHAAGRKARQRLEDAREGIGRLLGASIHAHRGDRVVFTSGGTEANNLALAGLASVPPGRIAVSAIEHPSVASAVEALATRGHEVQRLTVDQHGTVDVAATAEQFAQAPPRLVSVMLANNETGVIQPVAEIAALARRHGALVHTDAAQAVGKLPIDFAELGVDAMSVAAHKFNGPRGIGALILRAGVELRPQLFGGFQQAGLRPGTEPVALAVGMHAALQNWASEQHQRWARLAELRDRFEARLREIWPPLIVNGAGATRLAHTSNVALVGLDRQALLLALDMAGIACSTGSACASGSSEPSPTLLAMGLLPAVVAASLRFSLGATTTAAEIEQALERIAAVVGRLSQPKR